MLLLHACNAMPFPTEVLVLLDLIAASAVSVPDGESEFSLRSDHFVIMA